MHEVEKGDPRDLGKWSGEDHRHACLAVSYHWWIYTAMDHLSGIVSIWSVSILEYLPGKYRRYQFSVAALNS